MKVAEHDNGDDEDNDKDGRQAANQHSLSVHIGDHAVEIPPARADCVVRCARVCFMKKLGKAVWQFCLQSLGEVATSIQ